MFSKLTKLTYPLIALLLALTTFVLLLGRVFLALPANRPGLEKLVAAHVSQSGVSSPVTAVLLNFRGYDTLLEVTVLFLAAVGCWSMTLAVFPAATTDISPVQQAVVRLVAPVMILVAAYMVWQGSHFAGGAFQGGAILASIVVLLLVSNLPGMQNVPATPLRIGLAAGPLFFLTVAVGCLFFEGNVLQYPLSLAPLLLLLIEIICAVSIGLTLAALFAGGRPKDDCKKTP